MRILKKTGYICFRVTAWIGSLILALLLLSAFVPQVGLYLEHL